MAAGTALAAAALARAAYAALRRYPPGGEKTWTRTNHRGEVVTLLEGPALTVGAVTAQVAAAAIAGRLASHNQPPAQPQRSLLSAPPRMPWPRPADPASRPADFPGLSVLSGPRVITGPTATRGPTAISGPTVISGLGALAFGLLDDLAGSSKRKGLRGHLGALAHGEVTTGAVKLAGLAAAGLVAAVALDRAAGSRGAAGPGGTGALSAAGALPDIGALRDIGTLQNIGALRDIGTLSGIAVAQGVAGPGGTVTRGVDIAVNAALIAGGANLLNLFDLRPGRALKVATLCAALIAAGAPPRGAGGSGLGAVAAPAGAGLALLPEDLGERAMLGDAGANAIGAMLGTAAAQTLPRAARIGVLAGIVALTAASEKISFTRVIQRTPPLHWLDMLGRRPLPLPAPLPEPAPAPVDQTQPASAQSAPAQSGPALSGPALSGPALSEPAFSKPALSEPALPGPALSDPLLLEPTVPEPALSQAAPPEPAVPYPATAQGAALRGEVASGEMAPNGTGSSETGSSETGSSETGSSETGSSETQSHASQRDTDRTPRRPAGRHRREATGVSRPRYGTWIFEFLRRPARQEL